MLNIFTSLTVLDQPSPRFHAEAWLAFRNYSLPPCRIDEFPFIFLQINCPLFVSCHHVHNVGRTKCCRHGRKTHNKGELGTHYLISGGEGVGVE